MLLIKYYIVLIYFCRFRLLHAETITKLIPILVNAHLETFDFYYARNLLKIEHHALISFPIDFVQVCYLYLLIIIVIII